MSSGERENRRFLELFWIPWAPERERELENYNTEEMAAIYDSIPADVLARIRLSPLCQPVVPDSCGVRDRQYLDKSTLGGSQTITCRQGLKASGSRREP